jgi:hypothetical protein
VLNGWLGRSGFGAHCRSFPDCGRYFSASVATPSAAATTAAASASARRGLRAVLCGRFFRELRFHTRLCLSGRFFAGESRRRLCLSLCRAWGNDIRRFARRPGRDGAAVQAHRSLFGFFLPIGPAESLCGSCVPARGFRGLARAFEMPRQLERSHCVVRFLEELLELPCGIGARPGSVDARLNLFPVSHCSPHCISVSEPWPQAEDAVLWPVVRQPEICRQR